MKKEMTLLLLVSLFVMGTTNPAKASTCNSNALCTYLTDTPATTQASTTAATLASQGLAYTGSDVSFVSDTTGTYLSIANGGTTTLSFTSGQSFDTISFEWGSVNSGNTITLVAGSNSARLTYGEDVASKLNFVLTNSSIAYITLTGLSYEGITSIIFSTDSTGTFDIANLTATAAVPLPAALPLFGAALLGFAGFKTRKNKASAA